MVPRQTLIIGVSEFDNARIGAFGYVLKACASSDLAPAIREAIAGRRYVWPLAKGGTDPG
jgi:DNA-binding NarL/FixJ family response regulator